VSRLVVDVPELHRLWAKGLHENEICRRLDIRKGSWWLVRTRYALPPRDGSLAQMMLDADQVEIVTELWNQGEPLHAIAMAIGVAHHVLKSRMEDQLCDLPERTQDSRGGRQTTDPSADEIAERAAALRATWSPEEEEKRRVGRRKVSLQRFAMSREYAFSALD